MYNTEVLEHLKELLMSIFPHVNPETDNGDGYSVISVQFSSSSNYAEQFIQLMVDSDGHLNLFMLFSVFSTNNVRHRGGYYRDLDAKLSHDVIGSYELCNPTCFADIELAIREFANKTT